MIGVCLKYYFENYGGMLQAYATIKMLEYRGLEYELIRYEKERTLNTIIKQLPRLLNGVLLNDKYEATLKKAGMKLHPLIAENNAKRMAAFQQFCGDHFVKVSPVYKGYNQLCKGAERYQAMITGSDQLWSPAGLPTNYYNLMFVPEEKRKISYASSFGVKNIPWYQKKRTAAFLKRIEFVSMREQRGSEIVLELTGRKVPTVLDPVFSFDRKEWDVLIPMNSIVKEPYIFAYFLGNNRHHREVVKEVARKLGLKIVALRHLDQYVPADESFGDFSPYDLGPDGFLNLLRNAEFICTDSFHGTCFSIIYKKKFVVFNRYSDQYKHSKNSRIDSICDMFGLEKRRFSDTVPLDQQLSDSIDYDTVYQKLQVSKQITEAYLDEALCGLE